MSDEMDKLRKRLVKEAKEKGIQRKRLDAEAKVMREWRVKHGPGLRELAKMLRPPAPPTLKRTIGKKATAIKKAVTTAGGTLGKAVSTAAKQVPKAAKAAAAKAAKPEWVDIDDLDARPFKAGKKTKVFGIRRNDSKLPTTAKSDKAFGTSEKGRKAVRAASRTVKEKEPPGFAEDAWKFITKHQGKGDYMKDANERRFRRNNQKRLDREQEKAREEREKKGK
jgi:hypothetical protein